jgi:hypothetical protein
MTANNTSRNQTTVIASNVSKGDVVLISDLTNMLCKQISISDMPDGMRGYAFSHHLPPIAGWSADNIWCLIADVNEQFSRSKSVNTSQIVNLSYLVALTSSPSVIRPVDLAEYTNSTLFRNTFHTQTSIQRIVIASVRCDRYDNVSPKRRKILTNEVLCCIYMSLHMHYFYTV